MTSEDERVSEAVPSGWHGIWWYVESGVSSVELGE